jgi:hypothetical protein
MMESRILPFLNAAVHLGGIQERRGGEGRWVQVAVRLPRPQRKARRSVVANKSGFGEAKAEGIEVRVAETTRVTKNSEEANAKLCSAEVARPCGAARVGELDGSKGTGEDGIGRKAFATCRVKGPS